MEKKLAVLVDGSSFVYRAFYALPQLTRADEKPVGAIYGFSSMLLGLLEKHESDLFCVMLDSGRKTFRKEMYPEYKANRSEMTEELRSQLPMIAEVCEAFGVPIVKKDGYEADDLLATYANRLVEKDFSVRIVSPDKDLTQLIDDKISLFDPMKSKIISSDDVLKKFGVLPSQMRFFQALVGDSSDNIPGVKGIGPVTAAKLIQQFSSLDELYEKIDFVEPKKVREKLIEHKNEAELSLKLVTLEKNIELDENFDQISVQMDYNKAHAFLFENDFNSLVKRLEKKTISKQNQQRKYIKISTLQELQNFFELSRSNKFSFFCTSCTSEQCLLSICDGSNVAHVFGAFSSCDDMFAVNESLSWSNIQNCMAKFLSDPSITKLSLTNVIKCFRGFEINSFEDVSKMSYLLHGPEEKFVGDVFFESSDPICKLQFYYITEPEQVCKISELIFDSYEPFLNSLKDKNLLKIYKEIDLPVSNILRKMEETGIKISSQQLNRLAKIFSEKISELENEIYKAVGMKFKIGSVKQLAEALFEKLNLPSPKKKKTLDVESLEEMSLYSPVPAQIIEWRKFSKLLSTYTTSLCDLINPKTGRLHTNFNMTSTLTGRLSSSNPNLQNIPTRTEYGKLIKNAFIAEDGCRLISCDYSQIELRILAHMADIKFLRESFLSNSDIHRATAASVFKIPLDDVTDEMRSKAKAINFGIIYGMSGFRLSQILKVSPSEAKNYITNYFEKIPEYEIFRDNTLNFARKFGYVETLSGRRCYIKDINSANYQLKSFSERQAVNAVIQGSAADVVKIAMIKVFPYLSDLKTKLLLQIHDELVFETPNEYVEDAKNQLSELMEQAVKISIPLIVNVKCNNYLQ